jgi:hypothetical protein
VASWLSEMDLILAYVKNAWDKSVVRASEETMENLLLVPLMFQARWQ